MASNAGSGTPDAFFNEYRGLDSVQARVFSCRSQELPETLRSSGLPLTMFSPSP